MKKVWLMRHGKSSWKNVDLVDKDRPMKKRGIRDVQKMGEVLSNLDVKPDLLVTSHALRARSTAKIIKKSLGIKDSRFIVSKAIYNAGFLNLHNLIMSTDNKYDEIMIVGHNPDLIHLIFHYFPKFPLDNLPTGAVTCIEFKSKKWSKIEDSDGRLRHLDFPRNYFPKKEK